MEVDLIYYELKLQSLLEKFLENGYHIKNDVYFNRLLSFLGGIENKELAEVLLKLPLLSEWMLRAVKLWESTSQPPDHSISAFSLQLLGMISKNEDIFVSLSKYDIYNRIINVLRVKNIDSLPSIKLGFIKLLMSMVGHSSGRQWLLKTNYWQDIHILTLQNQTVYIRKEGHLFLASFLEAILEHNENFCAQIWKIIVQPLLINPNEKFRNNENLFEACDEEIEKFLGSTIYLINDILEYFFDKNLEGDNNHIKRFKHISLMSNLIGAVKNYLYLTRNENILYELSRIWILLLYISMMNSEIVNDILTPDVDEEFLKPSFSLLNILTENMKIGCVIRILYFIQIHWYKLNSKKNVKYKIDSDEKFMFEDQFLSLQLLPCNILCTEIYQIDDDTAVMKEEYITELFSKLGKNTIRWGYKWRNSLTKSEKLNELSSRTINYILQLKPMISRKSAILIFQCFLYCLAQIIWQLRKNKYYINIYSKNETFLKSLFEGLSEIIQHFDITWKDSIKSLCVLKVSVEFLEISVWSSMITIANLNLIKIAIKRYLSPDLALLVRKPVTDTIFVLVNLSKTKLHDPEWSVRDSALEVLSVVADASKIEFQYFKKAFLEDDCCSLILNISLVDGEGFVRASAIKCLNQLVQVDEFWKNLENQDVIKKMLSILNNETEGTVRAQAITLLTTLFQYDLIHPALHKEIYSAMSTATVDDLHWEVRLNSLSFWDDVVKRKLKDQGMVDGEFPKCTFSPETKKIISLTENEIQKRIIRVLDQLSEIDCLTILKHSISDDCDIQVSKRGLEISHILVDLIEKYKIVDIVNMDEIGPPSNDSCYSSLVPSTPSPSGFSSNEVIEQIIGASDTTLLKDVYSPRNEFSTDYSQTVQNRNFKRNRVTTVEFLKLTQKNFKALVDDRAKWINSLDSLSSLLNDMLESYEINDTNAMDCY